MFRRVFFLEVVEEIRKREKILRFSLLTFYTHKLHIHIVKLKKVRLIIIYDESISIRSFPSSNSHLHERFAWCLSFSFALAIGVIYTAYKKKGTTFSSRKKSTPRAKIIATTAPNASVARTFWRAKRTRVKMVLPFFPFFLDVDVEMCISKRLFVKRRRRRGEKIRQIHNFRWEPSVLGVCGGFLR